MTSSFTMNRFHKILYVLFAAGVAGVALLDFVGFFPALPFRGEAALIAAVFAGTVLIMVRDYSRNLVTLRPLATVTRASLPVRAPRRLAAVIEHAA